MVQKTNKKPKGKEKSKPTFPLFKHQLVDWGGTRNHKTGAWTGQAKSRYFKGLAPETVGLETSMCIVRTLKSQRHHFQKLSYTVPSCCWFSLPKCWCEGRVYTVLGFWNPSLKPWKGTFKTISSTPLGRVKLASPGEDGLPKQQDQRVLERHADLEQRQEGHQQTMCGIRGQQS